MKKIQSLIESNKSAKEIIAEAQQSGNAEAYKKFYAAKLKKYGIDNVGDLDDAKQKAFHDEIEKEWKADDEIKESKIFVTNSLTKKKELVAEVKAKGDAILIKNALQRATNSKTLIYSISETSKSSLSEGVYFSLDQNNKDRARNLSNDKANKDYVKNIKIIAKDLDDEGFDQDEVEGYLCGIVYDLSRKNWR